jgi:hypothetical protein
MVGRRGAFALVIAAACLASGIARAESAAQPTTDQAGLVDESSVRQRAKRLYEDGLTAYRGGRYSEAVDKLLEADHVMPNAAFSYNIALVYEAMGDMRSALRWLRSYLRQSEQGTGEQATVAKVRKLEAELQAKGLQQVSILSTPPGATLKIDGNALGITPFTTEITPGRHQISLSLNGYDAADQAIELRPDRSMDVEIALVASKVEPTAVAPAPAPPEPVKPTVVSTPIVTPPPISDRHSPRVKPWTWITIGAGAALFGGAIVYEVKRRDAEDRAAHASQADYQTRYDQIAAPQTTARAFVIAGSVVMTTGLVLLTVDLTRGGSAKTVMLGSCTTPGFCAALRGQF